MVLILPSALVFCATFLYHDPKDVFLIYLSYLHGTENVPTFCESKIRFDSDLCR